MSHRRSATSFAGVLWSTVVVAQAPSPWVELVPPAPVTTPTLATAGKLVLYRDGTFLRVFSAVTREWHAHTPSFGTVPVLKRDLLLVPESDRWTAFSAYRGTFAVLPVALASSTIQHADSVAAVVDGAQVHAFSAFTGAWHARALPAGWNVAVRNRIVLVHSPSAAPSLEASAFDAYTGQWHDLPPQTGPLAVIGLAGGAVVVGTAQQLFGFSPLRPGWIVTQATNSLPAQNLSPDGDLAAAASTVFSGITGTFAPAPLPAPTSSVNVVGDVVRTIVSPNVFVAGASGNSWLQLPAGTSSLTDAGEGVVLGWGTSQAHGFSPLRGVVASTPFASGVHAVRGNVAAIDDAWTGAKAVFSAWTGQWCDAPPSSTAGLPATAPNSATFQTANGVTAFSARTGALVALHGATRRGGFGASDAGAVYAFDVRTDRWLSQTWQPSIAVWTSDRVLLATDAQRAIAYGARGGQLAAQPLSAPVLATQVTDDVAVVRTATQVFAFAGLADTTTWQSAPDGVYGVGAGAVAHVQVRVPPGHLVALGFGPRAAAPTVVPPFGELWLDPAATVAVVAVPAPGEQRAVLTLAIPATTTLRGTEWLQQALTFAPGGGAWLGAPSTLLVQ